jgi:large subunit ribosomal protein L22
MTGPKLNEANRVAGVPSGVKAQARWVRMSASKFRPVLNLVRGLDVATAQDILRLSSVEAANVVSKVLASAVANATNNNGLDADKLYVKACFADESPTIKRFRPRARGRANTRLKRGAHVTVVVDELSAEALAIREASEGTGGGSAAARRRARAAAAQETQNTESSSDGSTDGEESK